jgi:hypothetical protein
MTSLTNVGIYGGGMAAGGALVGSQVAPARFKALGAAIGGVVGFGVGAGLEAHWVGKHSDSRGSAAGRFNGELIGTVAGAAVAGGLCFAFGGPKLGAAGAALLGGTLGSAWGRVGGAKATEQNANGKEPNNFGTFLAASAAGAVAFGGGAALLTYGLFHHSDEVTNPVKVAAGVGAFSAALGGFLGGAAVPSVKNSDGSTTHGSGFNPVPVLLGGGIAAAVTGIGIGAWSRTPSLTAGAALMMGSIFGAGEYGNET